MIARLLQWLSRPTVALGGTSAFLFVWVITGAFVDVIVRPTPPSSQAAGYIPWHRDWLGHYLSILTVTASGLFWYYEEHLRQLVPRGRGLRERQLRFQKCLAVPVVLICVLFVANNVWFVTSISQTLHWSQLAAPFWLPLLIAGSYYLMAIMPLLLNQLSYGVLLLVSSQRPQELKDFDWRDKERTFSLRPFGDAMIIPVVIILLIIVGPLVIQLWQKKQVTYASVFAIPLAVLMFVHICLRPLVNVSLALRKEKQRLREIIEERLSRLQEVIDSTASSPEEKRGAQEEKKQAREDLDLLREQRVLPVSQRVSIAGILTISSLLGTGLLTWMKDIVSIAKGIVSIAKELGK